MKKEKHRAEEKKFERRRSLKTERQGGKEEKRG